MMLKIIILCLVTFILAGCNKEPLQFYPQEHMQFLSTEVDAEGVDIPIRGERIVVVSPPETTKELLQVIEQYNKETVSEKMLEGYPLYYGRTFYKESQRTQRKYEISDNYTNIDGKPTMPFEDTIVSVAWRNGKLSGYYFYGDYAKKYCPHHIIYEDDGSVRERCRKEE